MFLQGAGALGCGALFSNCASLNKRCLREESSREFDPILRGGTVNDGDGGLPYAADSAILGDRIGAIGHLNDASAAFMVCSST